MTRTRPSSSTRLERTTRWLSSPRSILLPALLLALLAGSTPAAGAPARQDPEPEPQLEATVSICRAEVSGQAEPNTALTLEIRRPDDSLKGGASGNSFPFLGIFNLTAIGPDDQPSPAAAGDRVRLVAEDGPTIEDTVPDLDIGGDAAADRVTGSAPAGAAISVTVSSGLGFDAVSLPATAGPDGSFAVDFSGQYDIQDDSNLRIDLFRGPWTFRLERPLTQQINLRLHSAQVSGIGPVGSLVSAELERGGQVQARGEGNAAFIGIFTFALEGPGGIALPLATGDQLRIDFSETRSVDYLVPALSIEPDATADAVRGQAPAGTELSVSVGAGGGATSLQVTAGPDGRFEADFAGQVDIAPGSTGQVQLVERRPGTQISLSAAWAVTRLTLELGSPDVSGETAPGAAVALRLLDDAGRQLGSADAAVAAGGIFAGGADFGASLTDAEGDEALILPGRLLQYRKAEESIDLTVPELTAEIDVGADRVSGRAPAGAELSIEARWIFDAATLDLTAGPDGRYSADFAGQIDIVGGSLVTVTYRWPEGHRLILRSAAASMRVWPEEGRVDGTVFGGTEVTLTLRDDLGIPVAQGSDTAGFLGGFDTLLRDSQGAIYYPEPGDQIELSFEGLRRSMTVPLIGIDPDVAGDTVSGEVSPGGDSVTVVARPPAGQGLAATTRNLAIPESQFYLAEFAPEADLRAASRLEVTYTWPNGDSARIDRIIPYLNIQVGGNAVSGFALPRETVNVSNGVGGSAVIADDDHAFVARLRDGLGTAAINRTEAEVSARFALQQVKTVVEPLALDHRRDEDDDPLLIGRGPISQSLTLDLIGSDGTQRSIQVTTDQQGSFEAGLPGAIDGLAGTRFELSLRNADGHRFYAIDRLPRITAYLGSLDLGLEGQPLGSAQIRREPFPEGSERFETPGFDTEGIRRVQLQALRGGASGPAPIASGDVFVLDFQDLGGETTDEGLRMTVAQLTLEADGSSGLITGQAPVGEGFFDRFVQLQVYPLDGGPALTYTLLTDAEGRFSLAPSDPPLFAPDIDLTDVERIELIHADEAGHRTVATARPRPTILLPYLITP